MGLLKKNKKAEIERIEMPELEPEEEEEEFEDGEVEEDEEPKKEVKKDSRKIMTVSQYLDVVEGDLGRCWLALKELRKLYRI